MRRTRPSDTTTRVTQLPKPRNAGTAVIFVAHLEKHVSPPEVNSAANPVNPENLENLENLVNLD
jgi:hypothetical protein